MAGDKDWHKVALLLAMDGSDQSTTFVDERGNTFTAYGNAKLVTSVKKYGSASCYLDGSGDYATTPANTSFNFGSGNLTIEGWFYETASGVIRQIIGQHVTDAGQTSTCKFLVLSDNAKLTFQLFYGSSYVTAANANTHSLNAWHHFAAVRDGATMRLFLDGSQVATATIGTNTVNNSTRVLAIGAIMKSTGPDTGGYYFSGYLDDIRITVGLARYVSTFTPPAEALPVVPMTYLISGTVSAAEQPVESAVLRLYEGSTGELRAETDSDVNGSYEFETTDPTVIYSGETFFVTCHDPADETARPLAHGPITPSET